MFSRGLVLILCLALGLMGCSDFIKGKKAEAEVIELSDERFACLGDIPSTMRHLSLGEAQSSKIELGFDCLTDALNYFNKRTRGAQEGSYTVEEMRRFFGRYFLKKNNVTPELAGHLMKLKKAIIGGSTTSISKTEMVRLVEILGVLKEETVKIAPHVKILLSQAAQPKAEWENITAATEQLRLSLIRLLENTQVASSDYSFEDAKILLNGFARFLGSEETTSTYSVYSRYLPVIESVKTLMMGRQANFANASQWQQGLNSMVQVYELYLQYRYNLSDLKFENPAKVRQLDQFIKRALILVQNSHQIQSRGHIPLADIDNVLDQVVPLLKISVQPDSLKKVYRAVLVKMLDPDRRTDARSLVGLERQHLATLEREFKVWRMQQSFIDAINFGAAGAITQAHLGYLAERFDKNYVIEKGLTQDPYEQRALLRAWSEYTEQLRSENPVQFGPTGRLIISQNAADRGHSWGSLTKANFLRFLARMLMYGYGENLSGEAGIPQEGLELWYDEFRAVFLDIGAFDPRVANSGGRAFLEANFFTFSGDGDEMMNHKETFEFVSTLFAAGLASAETLRVHMVEAGCAMNEKDVFNKPFLKQDCFERELRARFALFFDNMPGMVKYVNGLKPEQWREFFSHLMAVSKAADHPAHLVETGNIRTLVTILHYIETMMVTFDRDRNQALSLDEVYAASPRFISFLKTIGGTDNELFLREGFAYLVFRGGVPGAADLAGFQFSKLGGVGEAERLQIVRIFGTLKDQLNKPAN